LLDIDAALDDLEIMDARLRELVELVTGVLTYGESAGASSMFSVPSNDWVRACISE
jgi:hypothetical protein